MVCSEVEQSLFLWYQSFFHLIVLALCPHSHKGHSTNLFQQRCFSYAIFPSSKVSFRRHIVVISLINCRINIWQLRKKCKHIFSKWSKENTEEQKEMLFSRNWNMRMKTNENHNRKNIKWKMKSTTRDKKNVFNVFSSKFNSILMMKLSCIDRTDRMAN